MTSFREFFNSPDKENNTRTTPAEAETTSEVSSRVSKATVSSPMLRLPRLFRRKKKVEAIRDERLILRTAKRGLSLTLNMRSMKAALMANDLEVSFLCDTWPELLHEFEKAGFQESESQGTYDVLVVDINSYDLNYLYPLSKRTTSFVLLGSIDILPSDRVRLVDQVEELRGVLFKSGGATE